MDEMKNKEITEYAMSLALKYGCQDVKVVLLQNNEDAIDLRNGQMERMHHALARSLVMNLFLDGRDGFFYTNKVEKDGLDNFIRQAVETTRMLEPDESHTLADPSLYYKGDGPELCNFDATLSQMDPQEKLALAMETDRQLVGSHPSIISAETRYSDRQYQGWYLISNGFQGYEECSRTTLTSICTVEGKDGQHPMDGWGESRIFFRDMPRNGIAETALQRTLRKVGQRPVKSGRYTMIVESPVAGNLLVPMLGAMTGQSLHQCTSFLQHCQDVQVGSPLLDVVDDPLIPGTRGASHFDEDGVATKRRMIFEKGHLRTYFIDTPSAHKLGLQPTTLGVHHMIFTPGDSSLDQLMHQAGEAILVTDFNGGNCDPSTGYFSYGVEGFWVKNGIIVQPVSGMNVTGSMLDLWKSLVAVGNDADPWEAELIPSLMFEGVAFSGV